MPTAPLRVCLEPGCPVKVTAGRCLAHRRQREANRHNVDIRRWYRTARWTALKAQKRAENPLCWACEQQGRYTLWTDLDHVIPHRGDADLFWNSDNLRGLCQTHHSQKTKRGE